MSSVRRLVALVAVLSAGLGWSATVARTAGAQPVELSGAVFEWAVNDESNTGAFNGQCNFMSGGTSDGSAATYRAADGDATVWKRTVSGSFAPVSDYATRCRDANGTTVTPGGSARLGQKVVYTNGTGTLDAATGATRISWRGTFSINFYGTLAPFWFSDPVLTVDADGNGAITATIGGYASSIDDPDVRSLIEPIAGVEIATLRDVDGANLDGFVATPRFEGVQVEVVESPQIRAFPGWGSWPESFVRAMERLGTASYWYSSGGAADARKVPSPVVVAYGTGTAPTTTVAPTTVPPTTIAPTTVPPTTVAPTTAPPTAAAPDPAGSPSAGILSATATPSTATSSGAAGSSRRSGVTSGAASATGSDAPATSAEAGSPGAADDVAATASSDAVDARRGDAELVFTELEARYVASANPLAPGTMLLTYRVRNAGDLPVRATRTATVAPSWGRRVVDDAADLAELAPGESATVTQSVAGVWPGGDTRSQVELVPYAVDRDDAVSVRPAIARTSTSLAPWPQVALALVALGALAAAVWWTRRRWRRRHGIATTAGTDAHGAVSQNPTPWRTT